MILVTGSHRPDVKPETVTARLDTVALSCEMCGAALSVLHGAAPGVDTIAADWATAHGHDVYGIEADWGALGNAAGPVRNRKLLEVLMRADEAGMATRCEAFPGPISKGAWDMVKLCRAQGLIVEVTT